MGICEFCLSAKKLTVSGRSSDSIFILSATPSRRINASGMRAAFVLDYSGGPSLIFTGFPIMPFTAPAQWVFYSKFVFKVTLIFRLILKTAHHASSSVEIMIFKHSFKMPVGIEPLFFYRPSPGTQHKPYILHKNIPYASLKKGS